jgi:hypothetical protein
MPNAKKFNARPSFTQPSLFTPTTAKVEPALKPRVRITHARKQLKRENWNIIIGSVRNWRSTGATYDQIVVKVGQTYGVSVSSNTVSRIINRTDFYRTYEA